MKNDRDDNGLTKADRDREREAHKVLEFKRNLAKHREVMDPLAAAGPAHYVMPVYAFGKQKRPWARLSWWQRFRRRWL
jgi:hypothetical protein